MKNRKGFKIVLSVASVGFMFLGIYQFAFASTFGGMNLYQSDRSSIQPSPTKVVDSVSTATVNTSTSNNSTANNTSTTSQTAPKTIATVSLPKTWTLDAVSKFNGIGGNPAYIVVSGKIYDVTSIGAWDGGDHKGIRAGQDVTTFFASSPHSASLLSQLPVVGNLGDSIASSVKTPAVTDATSSASLSNSSDDDDYDDEIEDHDSEDDEDEDENDHDEDEDEDDDHAEDDDHDEDDSHENEDDDDSHDD